MISLATSTLMKSLLYLPTSLAKAARRNLWKKVKLKKNQNQLIKTSKTVKIK
ncbi:UNVERIFIED_CONTAM: hypothetical protein NCL1_59261 [Trichonephila clavipes]